MGRFEPSPDCGYGHYDHRTKPHTNVVRSSIGSLKTNIEIEAIWQAFVNPNTSQSNIQAKDLNTAIPAYGKFELIIQRAFR